MTRPAHLLLAFCIMLVAWLAACSDDGDDARTSSAGSIAASNGLVPDDQLPDGVEVLDTHAGDGDLVAVPYTKYRFDNGLTVILHEDHSDPLVHVNVSYHVGASREEPGRSGFAHFFEHMMFQGSANVGDDEHFRIVAEAGGSMNGYTTSDATTYFETVPENQLETALWLEADRMGFLLPAVTSEKFEIQRATVKNERAQVVDNVPYGRAFEVVAEHLYPEAHPYSWPVIGWIEDLDAASLEDLQRFFLRWYGPNNAVLALGGDLVPSETLALVKRYFGSLPRGPEVDDIAPQPAVLDGDRHVTLEDAVPLPLMAVVIPTVYAGHADQPALDAATKLLGEGQASVLQRALVETGQALDISAFHLCQELGCELWMVVTPNPNFGPTLGQLEGRARALVTEFAQSAVSDDALQSFRGPYELARVTTLQSVDDKVSDLANAEILHGDPRRAAELDQLYLAVTPGDVQRVAEQYLADAPALVLSAVPHGETSSAAAPADHEPPARAMAKDADSEPVPLRTPVDDFDRSQRPALDAVAPPVMGAVWKDALDNTAPVWGIEDRETPQLNVMAVFDAGSRDDPPGQAGLAALTVAMLEESSENRSAAEFAAALDSAGARITFMPDVYNTIVWLTAVSRNSEQALELFHERVLQPAFLEEDFVRVKAQTLDALQQLAANPGAVAERASGAALYGPEHPLSFPVTGLLSTVAALTLQDVIAFYTDQLRPHLLGALVSSDDGARDVVAALQPLGEIALEPQSRTALPPPASVAGRTLYLVDKPGAVQSSLRVVQHALPYDALGDFYQSQLGNFPLGGSPFSNRINLNLREDKGYTYGAFSIVEGGPEVGSLRVLTDVLIGATTAAITEVLQELERYDAQGMSEEEFDFLKKAMSQQDALAYETPDAKLMILFEALRYRLPDDFRLQQQRLLKEATRESLNEQMSKLLAPDDLDIVVVTDVTATRPELESLGLPIVELDSEGNPLAPAND
jgi:zinc protease